FQLARRSESPVAERAGATTPDFALRPFIDTPILFRYRYNKMQSHPRILLISNSTVYRRGYLDHVDDEIRNFLGPAKIVLFLPFALFDRDAYVAKVAARFKEFSYELRSIHKMDNQKEAIANTDAIFVGGGNTFRLLKSLQDLELLEPIRRKVKSGAPYIGSSAGSNVAGPTIKTTKDMPIVQPRSFDSLGLVPFQIS